MADISAYRAQRVNNAVAPAFKAELVSAMLDGPFSILVDGSNDAGLQKNESNNSENI